LYKNISGEQLSKQDRGTIINDDFSLVYGEIVFESFVELLERANPKKDEVFYDLGSGTGKAVITSALTQNFSKCVGVELLPSLYKASESVLGKLTESAYPEIKFIQGDLFQIDISEANIVFINATGFFGETFYALVTKLKSLTPGTRIIIISKELKSKQFQLQHQDVHLMSWAWTRGSVYEIYPLDFEI
jgi:trans-aconitate methyltransferase